MKRKANDLPVRIYTYGLPFGPRENAALVDEQMRLARRYFNSLLEIEIKRREQWRAVIAEVGDVAVLDAQIADVDARIAALRSAVKSERAAKRKRVTMDAAGKEAIASLKAERMALREERKALQHRLRHHTEIRARLDAVNERAAELVRERRGDCGVYWGTYLLVEQAIEAVRRSKTDPRFRRWDGSGRVGVQIQHGIAVRDVFAGTDTRLRIDPPCERNRTTLHLRIGSDGRAPVWASFPMVLHRPLPEEGRVKWAWVSRRKHGARWRWEAQFSLEAPSFGEPSRGAGVVAVDFGAKGESCGRRVARAVGEDGCVFDLTVPERGQNARGRRGVHDALAHADHIRSRRDIEFDAVRETLLDWLAVNEAPEWLGDELRWLAKWRSPDKLHRVLARWGRERCAGDDAIVGALTTWAGQDRHLHQWEADERRRAQLYRREAARVWASQLARRYALLVTEDIDLAALMRHARPEDDQVTVGNRARREGAPGEAREWLRSKFAGREKRLETCGRAGTCPACMGRAIESAHVMVCTSCDARIDADFARCWHLLRDAGASVEKVEAEWRKGAELEQRIKERVKR